MGQENKDKKQQPMSKNDLTGKAEQSEAEIKQAEAAEQTDNIEQTERERHNKGAKDVTPEGNKERDELKEAPESLKKSH